MILRAALMPAALFAAFAGIPAQATIYLSQSGSRLYISGEFEEGDHRVLEAHLAGATSVKPKTVFLDSYGGQIGAGIAIANVVRKARLATAVDAKRARCDSACTLIFAAGVRRHYINGADVFEGTSGRGGLGYHPSHSRDGSWTRIRFSEQGTGKMANFYRRMGQPGAVELMRRAGFTTIYRPSGATALKLRIATSLDNPSD